MQDRLGDVFQIFWDGYACSFLCCIPPHTKPPKGTEVRIRGSRLPRSQRFVRTAQRVKETTRPAGHTSPGASTLWGSQEANPRTRQGCNHAQFCRRPQHLQGTSVLQLRAAPETQFGNPSPKEGAHSGHVPQVRTLYWEAISSRASFMPSRGLVVSNTQQQKKNRKIITK